MEIKGLSQAFAARLAHAPEQVYATGPQGDITFAALAGAADAMAARLAGAGVRRGDRVVVMMRNSPASLAMIFGLIRGGYVWVPGNPALVGEGLAHVLRQVEAALAVCDPEVLPALQACGQSPRQGILVIDDPALPAPSSFPGPQASGDALPAPSDLASIMFTSGTTGPAKGVQVTHMMLELAAHGVMVCADIRAGDNLYIWEPFYHVGGAQVLVLPLLVPVRLTLSQRFSASRFWSEVTEAGCTHIHHLGGIIQILLKQPASALDRAHGVRIAWGGGCVPQAWRLFEERFGVELRECYGMTEASSLTTVNLEGVVGSVGRPLPWFDVRIQDEAGRVLGRGEGRGQIIITSPLPGAIFAGYYRAPEATAKALRADGFHTGDIGSWDDQGMLFFHGRAGDSIRCRGENVSAYEVEAVVNRHPDVEESAMVGVPAEIGEYDILLYLRLRPGSVPDAAAIAAWLDDKLPAYQRPRYVRILDAFPKTPSQRIQKHLLPRDLNAAWQRKVRA
ncbi:MAG: AMP-binding protein [Paracoccus sp. (in: a-proteobacteria)]|uniref:AMP-binding protein n=1 Tax=Paracoccus sp. TaxID=267 RepID=UPI0039E5ECF6